MSTTGKILFNHKAPDMEAVRQILLMDIDGRRRLAICVPLSIVLVTVTGLLAYEMTIFLTYETERARLIHQRSPKRPG